MLIATVLKISVGKNLENEKNSEDPTNIIKGKYLQVVINDL